MTIKIEVRGLRELQAKIKKMFADNGQVITYLNARLGSLVSKALEDKPYPPERPGQTYRRTGNFGRSWLPRIKGRNTISIINPVKARGRFYANYVAGDKQAWMHVGRWWTARKVAEDNIEQALTDTEKEAETLWNG